MLKSLIGKGLSMPHRCENRYIAVILMVRCEVFVLLTPALPYPFSTTPTLQ